MSWNCTIRIVPRTKNVTEWMPMGLIQGYDNWQWMLMLTFRNIFVFITVQPIKKGELLMLGWLKLLLKPKEKRQKEYAKLDYICTRCEGIRPSPKQLIWNPLYRNTLLKTVAVHSDEKVKTLMDKCEIFLRKYGEFSWFNSTE